MEENAEIAKSQKGAEKRSGAAAQDRGGGEFRRSLRVFPVQSKVGDSMIYQRDNGLMSTTSTYRFTVDDYDRMIESGVFEGRDGVRVELLYGEIVEMNPPNPPHDYVVDLLNYWSIDVTNRNEIWVRIPNCLGIPEFDSVPEPDVAWMKTRDYRQRRPEPEDLLLLIEVAESSLGKDRHVKGKLYAEAGVQDYWIVDLNNSRIEVYRRPDDGVFLSHETYGSGEFVSPLVLPDVKLDVSGIVGR